jgi:glutamate synthase domain-containing protein 1
VILLFKTTVCSGNGFHQKPSWFFAKTTWNCYSQSKFDIIGWRDVPLDVSNLGQISRKEPIIKQVFIGKNEIRINRTSIQR